nr:hypothetical protein [Tanacetum cinerariifolium]
SDILHVNADNPQATFVGDLSDAPHIPDNLFDCLVLTQTLHVIYDYQRALATCHRILKPGGTLLLTVPGITPIDAGEWKSTWYWSFTDRAVQRMLIEAFPGAKLEIQSYGNVFIASAFLYGMGVVEVSPRQLDSYDPQYQVINAAKVVKAPFACALRAAASSAAAGLYGTVAGRASRGRGSGSARGSGAGRRSLPRTRASAAPGLECVYRAPTHPPSSAVFAAMAIATPATAPSPAAAPAAA